MLASSCANSIHQLMLDGGLVFGAKCRSRLDLRGGRTKKAPKHYQNPSIKLRSRPKSAFLRSCTGKPRSFAPQTSTKWKSMFSGSATLNRGSAGREPLFAGIFGIGTLDPALGPLPARPQPIEGGP